MYVRGTIREVRVRPFRNTRVRVRVRAQHPRTCPELLWVLSDLRAHTRSFCTFCKTSIPAPGVQKPYRTQSCKQVVPGPTLWQQATFRHDRGIEQPSGGPLTEKTRDATHTQHPSPRKPANLRTILYIYLHVKTKDTKLQNTPKTRAGLNCHPLPFDKDMNA